MATTTDANFDVASHRIDHSRLKNMIRIAAGGAQGSVHKAELDGKQIAVKVIPGDADMTRTSRALRIKHANIIETLNFCEIPYCLVMELCKSSLYAVIHSGNQKIARRDGHQITSIEFRDWTMQIASGMAYLHSNGITHGDLTSLNDFDRPKKFDFCDMKTTSDAIVPVWMAPEILRSEEYATSVRGSIASFPNKSPLAIYTADVWSFGVVVWELVTQCFPYDSAATTNRVQKISSISEGTLRLCIPKLVSQPLKILMMSCMNTDAAKRPKFDKIVQILQIIVTDDVIWKFMKSTWIMTKYNYSYTAEKQENFDKAREIAIKKAERICLHLEKFIETSKALLAEEECEMRELADIIANHEDFMEKFAVENFLKSEPMIENLLSLIDESKSVTKRIAEKKIGTVENKFYEEAASRLIRNILASNQELTMEHGTRLLYNLLLKYAMPTDVVENGLTAIFKAIRCTNKEMVKNCYDILKLPKMKNAILKQKVPAAEILLETLKKACTVDRDITASCLFLMEFVISNTNKKEKKQINHSGMIELIVQYLTVTDFSSYNDAELVVYNCWSILSHSTSEGNSKDAERFAKAGGLYCFQRLQKQFSNNADILWRMSMTMSHVWNTRTLLRHLKGNLLGYRGGDELGTQVGRDIISNLISYLDIHVDCVYLSHRIAYILTDLLAHNDDHAWHQAGIAKLEVEEKIIRVILSWEISADLRVFYDSLSLACLSYRGHNVIHQLVAAWQWASQVEYVSSVEKGDPRELLGVWTLANLTLFNPEKYCPLFINDGGLPALEKFLNDSRIDDNVQFYAQLLLNTVTNWQHASINVTTRGIS